MAVAVRSATTTAFAAKTASGGFISITLNAPAGLAAGDLMLVHIANDFTGLSWVLSGWTEFINNSNGTNIGVSWLWKVATAADVTAGSFTFTQNTGGGNSAATGGGIMAITGADPTTPILVNNKATASGTNPSFADTITPSVADCLIVFGASGVNGTNQPISNPTIATSPPTFTIQWNLQSTLGGNFLLTASTGVRNQTTATGNSSATCSASKAWAGELFAVQPTLPVVNKFLSLLGVGT